MKHSPSSLLQFNKCPRMYHHERVLRDVERLPPGDAALEGSRLHEQVERRVKHGEAMQDPSLVWVEGRLSAMEAKGVELESEVALALDEEFRPCAYKDGWVRGYADLVARNDSAALVIDFKFGKRRVEFIPWLQLEFYALAVFQREPELQVCWARFDWVKSRKCDLRKYTRADVPMLTKSVLGKMLTVEREEDWEPRPSGLCGRFCSVPQSKCEFSGREG